MCGRLSLLSSRCVAQDDVVMHHQLCGESGREEVEQDVLPGQQRLGPLQVQHSQGEVEYEMIFT